jgi:radical SAM superfamily enzyme YgiQ (UPF0313 family)
MINNKVLLVDPSSINHMPPSILNKSELERTQKYSQAINTAVASYLNENINNINAFSGKYAANYGLLMLSYLLKQKNISVDFISGDYFKKEDLFFEYIIKNCHKYKIVCLTSTTPQFEQIKKINSILKEKNKDIITILGGPHTLYYKTGMIDEEFSIINIGCGIDKTVEIIVDVLQGKKVENRIVKTDYYYDCPKDFDAIPKKNINNTILYSYVSFGCPNNCNYCMEHKLIKKVCFNNIENKIIEIKNLVYKYGRKFIHLADSDFLLNREYSQQFIDLFENSNIKCCLSINATPNTLSMPENFDLIKKLIKNGLVEILIGVEHFSPKVLKTLNKNYDINNLFKALNYVKSELKLPIMSLYSLVGLPMEDHEAINENLLMFKKLNNDKLYDFSFPKFFVPYPDTDIYLNPEKYNVKILSRKWDKYHRWSLPRPIEIIGMKDDDYLKEIEEISKISEN